MMRRRKVMGGLAVAAASVAALFAAGPAGAVTTAPLDGDWNFLSGSGTDLSGNWTAPFMLHGTATFSGGLVVSGTGNGGNAATGWANASGYTGPTIDSKTLISWVKLDSTSVASGSPMSIYSHSLGDVFDAVDYAERQQYQWMAGSDFFNRTQDFSPGFADQGDPSVIRKVAISYQDNNNGTETVTGCLNGQQLGQYTTGDALAYPASSAPLALFGPRHEAGSPLVPVGSIDAHILESRIYGQAMTCAQVAALPQTTTSPPSCKLTAVRRNGSTGHDQGDVTVKVPTGLASISNVQVSNGSVNVPSFTTGTTSPVIVTATKQTQGQTTVFSFDVTDLNGVTTHCS